MPDPDEPTTPFAPPGVGAADAADVADARDEPETAGVLSVETALMGPVAGGSFAAVGDGIHSPCVCVGGEINVSGTACQIKSSAGGGKSMRTVRPPLHCVVLRLC
jgi:hypothetical protein